jgi:hypothetical protein
VLEKISIGPNGLTQSTNSVPVSRGDTDADRARQSDALTNGFRNQQESPTRDPRPGNSPYFPK